MKVIIAGSRGITDHEHVDAAMARMLDHEGWSIDIDEIVSGMCPNSPDMLGVQWARANKIPVKEMPAKWLLADAIKDPSAGRRRNVEMAKHAGKDGILVAVWDGKSPGTKHMINAARSRGLKVYIHKVTA